MTATGCPAWCTHHEWPVIDDDPDRVGEHVHRISLLTVGADDRVEIDVAQRITVGRADPVVVHLTADVEPLGLSPADARRVAAALLNAADLAEQVAG